MTEAPAVLEQVFRQAVLMHRQGRLAEADALYARVLRGAPRHAGALLMAALLAQQSGNYPRAAYLAQAALQVEPRNPGAWLTLAAVMLQLQRPAAAVDCCDRLIALQPDQAQAHHHRGLALSALGRHGEALDAYDRSIAIDPGLVEAWIHRAGELRLLGRPAEALHSVDRALALRADDALAHSNRGNLLSELGRPAEALESYTRAIALQPRDPLPYCNRGILYSELEQLDRAIDSLNGAIGIDPQYAPAYFARAMIHLLNGDFAQGWADFEWRWTNEHSTTARERRVFAEPRWDGRESLSGKTILVFAEQGLGDTVQFCRYATLLAARGAAVVMEVQPAVAGLVSGVDGVRDVVRRGDPLPPFDVHCPMLSLPLAFGTTLETIPARIPYLKQCPDRLRQWRQRLGPGTLPRVGLVWSGGTRPDQPELAAVNRRRNIPLEAFSVLAGLDVQFYSLQKGPPAESDLARLCAAGWQGPRIIDLAPEIRDFTDTAAAIASLDLLISVDTSTAHVAGALGAPVWLLNRRDTCWRWLLDREDTPWYPTLRIYRQPATRDWGPVLAAVRADLARMPAAQPESAHRR